MSTYWLLCSKGFWYQGMRTDRMERDFCDAKLVEDLKRKVKWPTLLTTWINNYECIHKRLPSMRINGGCRPVSWRCFTSWIHRCDLDFGYSQKKAAKQKIKKIYTQNNNYMCDFVSLVEEIRAWTGRYMNQIVLIKNERNWIRLAIVCIFKNVYQIITVGPKRMRRRNTIHRIQLSLRLEILGVLFWGFELSVDELLLLPTSAESCVRECELWWVSVWCERVSTFSKCCQLKLKLIRNVIFYKDWILHFKWLISRQGFIDIKGQKHYRFFIVIGSGRPYYMIKLK